MRSDLLHRSDELISILSTFLPQLLKCWTALRKAKECPIAPPVLPSGSVYPLSADQSAELVAAWEQAVSRPELEEVTELMLRYPSQNGLEPGDRIWDATVA
eukprot:gnl/TRDRNA2_/TRDRNA2_221934_c0_seq1.p1 gnl/TRDRNA2_/TRDRNA2_221934_c0~~gnl/TRDRNA2_/TRDRNA2_221934_c0_seq1.p1  ORF type:complete len:101 (+),score=16.94 gnl/TRDRNA2_/TRDRNA2_221934_c0_seq1:2-304(+)